MHFVKKEYKKINENNYPSFILAGDIGGTNTNLGIFGVKNDFPALLVSFHFKSNKLEGLHHAIDEVLFYSQKNYKIKITKACLAVAGFLSPDKSYGHITNINWDVGTKVLLKKTALKKIILINDFEAIGYAINLLSNNDVITIKKSKKILKAPIVVIGAGTGLGKTTAIYDENKKYYVPIPSEAGHSDFAAQNDSEFELVQFIKKKNGITQNVPYELLLSGRGLENIYFYLRRTGRFKATKYTKEIDKAIKMPELISKYRKIDATCKATFDVFKGIYAKFARNMAVDSMAYNGVYISGGIAPKNKDIFDKQFVRIFESNYKMSAVLKKIPIYLIINPNAGLLGAGFAGARK